MFRHSIQHSKYFCVNTTHIPLCTSTTRTEPPVKRVHTNSHHIFRRRMQCKLWACCLPCEGSGWGLPWPSLNWLCLTQVLLETAWGCGHTCGGCQKGEQVFMRWSAACGTPLMGWDQGPYSLLNKSKLSECSSDSTESWDWGGGKILFFSLPCSLVLLIAWFLHTWTI